MRTQKLKYNDVFPEYKKTWLDIFVQRAFEFHLGIAKGLGRIAPHNLKNWYDTYEEFIEYHQNNLVLATPVPNGYNFKKQRDEEGYVNLEYIDLYDFLPKEKFQQFKKHIIDYRRQNEQSIFGTYMTAEDFKKIDRLENFSDGQSFYNIITCRIKKNRQLSNYCSQVSIKIMSLSPTYLIVQYRFFMSKSFNRDFNEIINKDYQGYFDVIRPAYINWIKSWRVSYTFYSGDDERKQKVYDFMGRAKWMMYTEIASNFGCSFGEESEFPPCFETYRTNIRPSTKRDLGFWESILLDRWSMEYSMELNMCISWGFSSRNEPRKIQALQGINGDSFGIMMSEISSEYAVYLVAMELNEIARKWMTICNRAIGKELKKVKSKSILNTRLKIEKRLYYSRRFIVEFESDLKNCCTTKRFTPATLYGEGKSFKRKSFTAQKFNSVDSYTQKTAKMIDNVINHFDTVAESNNTYFNYKIAKFALWIAIFSLMLTIIIEAKNMNFSNTITKLTEMLKSIKA